MPGIRPWMIGLGLLVFGGFFLYFGLQGLLAAFLTGMDVLTGRAAVKIDRVLFRLDDPWRTTLRSIGWTCCGGAAVFLGVMMLLQEGGRGAPQWWNRFWYRYVVGW